MFGAGAQRQSGPSTRDGRDPDIGDYALIGDCRTGALVCRDGSIDWLCLPHFSAPAVFAALLDQHVGGRFRLRPARAFTSRRHYLGDTAILCTTFETATGIATVTDLMPIGEIRSGDGLSPLREVLRMVDGVRGEVEFELLFQPCFDYARRRPRMRRHAAGTWQVWRGGDCLYLCAQTSLAATEDGLAVVGNVRVAAGERQVVSMTYARAEPAVLMPLGAAADARLERTRRWWEAWSARCTYAGPWRKTVTRSLITLKLLTYSLSGAVLAAPTTSLPECVGGVRNWDYRYCWLRDASFVLSVLFDCGYPAEGEAFLQWLLHATRLTWPELQVMYDVNGRTELREVELPHLAGYRASRPVRIGNGAHGQLQLDIYGALILAAYEYTRRGGRLRPAESRLLVRLGRTVCRLWREPDQGIWEMRDQPRHHTYSKLMCWAALDRLLALHDAGVVRAPAQRFRSERDELARRIRERGFNSDLGSYVGVLDGREMDASLLVLPRIGFERPGSERMLGTFRRLEAELERNGLLYRYRQGYDALPGGEGAFGILCFLVVDYLARSGRQAEAERRFEYLLGFGNDLGLFAEEIDPEDGTLLGNFPQAFTHVGVVLAALSLQVHATGRSPAAEARDASG